MALTTQSFEQYYNELATRRWSATEMLKFVARDEVGARKDIEAEENNRFLDMLHVMGVMIGDKKKLENGGAAQMDRFALQLQEKQRAVWFPAAPPRAVARPVRAVTKAFPHAAYKLLCKEETELRCWLHGVQDRLREHIEEACAKSWFIITCLQQLCEHEARGRARIERDEAELFLKIRKLVFLVAPPDYFRKQVIERYGETVQRPETPKELSFEEVEEMRRQELETAEYEARREVFAYLDEAYNAHLFMVNHQEVVERLEIMEEQKNQMYPLVEAHCRHTFSTPYHRTAAVVLHSNQYAPLMKQLCWAHRHELQNRALHFVADYTATLSRHSTEGAIAWEESMKDSLTPEEMQRVLAATDPCAGSSTKPPAAAPAPPAAAPPLSEAVHAVADAVPEQKQPPAPMPTTAAEPAAPAAAKDRVHVSIDETVNRHASQEGGNGQEVDATGSPSNPCAPQSILKPVKQKRSFHAFESDSD